MSGDSTTVREQVSPPELSDFISDVIAGLSSNPRTLPYKYFYDERGAALFQKICDLPEYYITRTEIDILDRNRAEIASHLGPNIELIGLGTGAGTKNRILIDGAGLKKASEVVVAAYHDSDGVTALFNLNVVARANSELGADFDLDQWRHRAIYNSDAGRIEMYLISESDQFVHLDEQRFHFRRAEKIVTEFSYKYSPEEFSALAGKAEFEFAQMWTDDARLFGVFYFVVRSG